LFDPYTNALVAAKYLKKQLVRYGGSQISAIAAYNSGTVLICKASGIITNGRGKKLAKCRPGGIANEVYLDKVLQALLDGR